MRRSASLACSFIAILTMLTMAGAAWADKPAPPAERRDAYSPYERDTIARAMQKVGGAIDDAPEGKILDGVDVVTLDVFEDRDPLPAYLTPIANWFHVTTRPAVIAREVLIAPGERYDQALVDQTARNLRALPQLSLVLCVPIRGAAPGHVRLLVVTKDVWSLRLNSNYTFANGRLQYLMLQPSEENLFGTHQSWLANFVLDPATISFGHTYILPRLAGSRINASAAASVIINRETGKVEGSSGSFSYGQPLYSTRAEWAWGTSISWDQEITRRFIAGLLTDFDAASGQCFIPGGSVTTADPKLCQYKSDVVSGNTFVTRSFGHSAKHDISIGMGASRKEYRILSAFTAAEQAAFQQAIMPVSDTQIGPYVEFHAYSARYFDVLDLDTLGLTESYQRGHDVTVRVQPVTRALRSSRNFVELYGSAQYTVPLGDGFVRAAVAHDFEIAADTEHGRVPDGAFSASLRIASPRFGHGRLVFAAYMLDRYANYLNAKTTLGGDGRLRGYPTKLFIGNNVVAANLEYRSDPIEVSAVQLGFTLFADTGDAFDTWKQMVLKQSAGFGFRLVFPQLQREVMRIDLGFPLTPSALPPTAGRMDVLVKFGQAF